MSNGKSVKVIPPVQAFEHGNKPDVICENFGIGISTVGAVTENSLPSLYRNTNNLSDLNSIISISVDKEVLNGILNEIDFSLAADDVINLLTKTTSFYVISKKLTAKENLSHFDVRQLSYFTSNSLFAFGSALTSPDRIDENDKRLNEVIARYKKVLHPIPRDGDCLFTSIIYAIDNATKPINFYEHLQTLQMTHPKNTMLDRVISLRSAMVQEWFNNSEEYEPFMPLHDKKFEDIALTYELPGTFSGSCGNLMVMALANVLKVNIVLFTSMEQMPVIPIIPRDALLTPDPIYVAFNHGGCGHYDAVDAGVSHLTDGANDDTTSVPDYNLVPEKKCCRCGKGGAKDKNQRTFCHQVPGVRRCQCPCYTNHVECTELCKCNNCNNPLGSRSAETHSVPQKRKREKHSFQELHQDTLTYMLDHGEQPCSPKWSLLEKFLLQNLLDKLIQVGHTIDDLDITVLYNQLVDIVVELSIDLPLSTKSSRCIAKQVDIFKKDSDLFRQIYLNQVGRNIDC